MNILFVLYRGDSDIVLDLISKVNTSNKATYVFFDTGLEYNATKEHLKYLESKYGVEIKTIKAIKPIPVCCKEYEQPFVSKYVSEMINRLQNHGFKREDESFEALCEKYPNCKSALKWWTNKCGKGTDLTNEKSRFNIARNKYLKEFLLQNPPNFKISNKCCEYAKKKIIKTFQKATKADLSISGVRKAEGGIRAGVYKNCYTIKNKGWSEYRPIFWFTNDVKSDYEKCFNIVHSACYTKYGLKRTGCAGCPYGRDFEEELKIIEKYEPQLYKAVNYIFKDSYKYTRKYKEFQKMMNEKEK